MKLKNHFLMVAALIMSSCSSWSFAKDRLPPVVEMESVVLNFEKGASQLNPDDAAKLAKVVADAKAKGKISKIELAVWSDAEHPATGELSKVDRNLAAARIKAVQESIKKEIGRSVSTTEYNMADNTNWVGRHLHTDEAELEAVFAKKTGANLARADFALIKSKGAASKAVAILKLETPVNR